MLVSSSFSTKRKGVIRMTNTTKGKNKRRLDKDRLTLRKGEVQRKNGLYSYRWTTKNGERKIFSDLVTKNHQPFSNLEQINV